VILLFGVWLGGIALEFSGHYDWLWAADIGLASLAVLPHMPLRDGDGAIAVATSGRARPAL